MNVQRKRDYSARSVPRFTDNVHRERNDEVFEFSADCSAMFLWLGLERD